MTRDFSGSVPWKWLAACLDCGAVHECRPAGGKFITWEAADGHAYRPRTSAWELHKLYDEYRRTSVP